MKAKTLTSLLLAIALAGSAAAVSAVAPPIQVTVEDGKSVAQFKIGDSRCVLVDDQILCTPVRK